MQNQAMEITAGRAMRHRAIFLAILDRLILKLLWKRASYFQKLQVLIAIEGYNFDYFDLDG